MVYAEIQPNNSSKLWQEIAEHDQHKFHYRRDRLFFGVCLEHCLNMVGFSNETHRSGENNFTINNEITSFFQHVHRRHLDIQIRTKYSTVMQQCLNVQFQQKYSLQLKTFIEYCESPAQETLTEAIDLAELIFMKFLEAIILMVFMSTIYDYFLKTRQAEENQRTNEFYKNNLEHPLSRAMTSFSLPRNYYRLTQPYRGVIGNDFSYLDGLRVMTTLLVLQAHTFFLEFQPMKNPEFFEKYGQTTGGLMVLNSSTVIEIFMVMSGLLLNVKFSQGRCVTPHTSWMKCMQMFLFIVLSRLVRFLPSVAFLAWTNATVLKNLGNGPFWRHVIEPSRIFSRENWWKNLLMINNFSIKDTASTHTWYLATDFQLFAFYSLVLIIISKYPHYKKYVYSILAALAVLIPTLVCYITKVDSSFVTKPEVYRYGYMKETDAFYYLYTPSYNSLSGYLVGMLCGELYMKYSEKQLEIREKFRCLFKYEMTIWLLVPLAVGGICYVGSIVNFLEPSIWTALHAGLNRNLWNMLVCAIPIVMMIFKGGMIIYDFCRLPMFRVLARLSFQMYLWNILILQITNGYKRMPQMMSDMYFNGQALISIALLTMVAFFSCLLIEYPFAQLFDALQTRRKQTGKVDISKGNQ
ncbi:uncharacterized protein isoform X2 [Musca autumnalis]